MAHDTLIAETTDDVTLIRLNRPQALKVAYGRRFGQGPSLPARISRCTNLLDNVIPRLQAEDLTKAPACNFACAAPSVLSAGDGHRSGIVARPALLGIGP